MSEKKSHGVQLLLKAVVKDPDGKVISDTGQKPSKSFVIQFLEFLYGLFSTVGAVNFDATDVNGNEEIIYVQSKCGYNFRIDALINDDTHGIVIGTNDGETAEDNEDYKLDTQLTEGAGAGNITHGAVTVGAAGVVGANVDIETKRTFTNNTGSTITVKECGVYTAASTIYHCIIRDVLPASIDVPDKCSLTVYYTFRTTV